MDRALVRQGGLMITVPRLRYICVVALVLLASSARLPSQSAALVFTHATVIDGTGAAPARDMTVTIENGRIASVQPSAKAQPPRGARVIDASGRYLIPGLWDMHVHWYDARYLSLFTANGVTGVRVMWGMPLHLQWRRSIAAGSLAGPRLYIAGPLMDGPNPVWPGSTVVSNAAEAR